MSDRRTHEGFEPAIRSAFEEIGMRFCLAAGIPAGRDPLALKQKATAQINAADDLKMATRAMLGFLDRKFDGSHDGQTLNDYFPAIREAIRESE